MSLTKQDLMDIRDVVLDALDVAINPRLDRLEEHMDQLEKRMDIQEAGQSETNSRLSSLENITRRHESGLHEISRRLSSTKVLLAKVDGTTIALQNDVIELYKMVKW